MRPIRAGLLLAATLIAAPAGAQETNKPVLHGRHWIAITGKPLAATTGALIFARGGNAVDAACAMLAATSTMWDVLSWGGETQALIYDPRSGEVVAINALGVAPTGATPEFFHEQGMEYPPELGPLAAVTPGTPGGLMTMLAGYGTMSLAEVLEPAIRMAEDGYPIEAQAANSIERNKETLKEWTYSREVMLPHLGEEREAPYPGELFRQPDLAATLSKLVEAERRALDQGKSREEAIQAAYDRFYRGDIAEEFVRGAREEGALFTMEDLAGWEVKIEEPVHVDYKGIEVYKLTHWVQGPVLLQMLNMLENLDLAAMGYNSARYIHGIYQVMSRAFADRDFYYGDPAFPPEEPIEGLLSKEYAEARIEDLDWERNDPDVGPGDPYPFQGETNPFTEYLAAWPPEREEAERAAADLDDFYRGTTTIQTADEEGWVVSVTPSGGWVPAVIAGRTGVGMSQRAQSFVLDPAENPFNVIEPGKRPRATLTPSLALKDGEPFLSFAVQGGDTQDQNLLQFFLNVVEFGMDPQEAAEAANFNTFQLRNSFGDHESIPGRLLLNEEVPPWVRVQLREMGYDLDYASRTSGPINAIWFDREHGTMWGASSDYGEDYGIAW
ncbi:MAG: gamma-glutamyltransferase family protein [Gemmatimonadota bacterium]